MNLGRPLGNQARKIKEGLPRNGQSGSPVRFRWCAPLLSELPRDLTSRHCTRLQLHPHRKLEAGSWKLQLHGGSSVSLQKGRGVNMQVQMPQHIPRESELLSTSRISKEITGVCNHAL